jgi:hypothetical protein
MLKGVDAMEDLNRRLAEAAESRARWEKLQRQVSRLEQEQRAAAERARQLKDELAREERDVERLESGSLGALLATLFTNREERLDREREEAAAALIRTVSPGRAGADPPPGGAVHHGSPVSRGKAHPSPGCAPVFALLPATA